MTSVAGEKDIKRAENVDFEVGSVDEKRKQPADVFAQTEDGPDFRGVSTFGAAALIIKSQFGLGVLGLPATFQVLGFVPGLVSLCVLCCLITWTGVVIGKFRLNHPEVHTIADSAYILFGRFGRELMGVAQWLYYTLSFGSALITLGIAFNSLSDQALCITGWLGIWSAICLVIGLVLRTMKVLQWSGYVAVVSIFAGVWIVSIACLAQSTPAAAPVGEPIVKNVKAVATGASYSSIAAAVATQLYSLAGTTSFFVVHAEMKDQTKYVRSLLLGQGFVVFNYLANSCIVYAKVGDYVASPALGSAGPLIMKVAYGVALPALIFTAIFQVHIAAKYGMVRILRGTSHLQRNSLVHWATWGGMWVFTVVIGFVVAGCIPFFNNLVGLAGALFGTSFALIVPGFMTLYEMTNGYYTEPGARHNPILWLRASQKNWTSSKKNIILATVSWICIIVGFYIGITGVYGSVTSIAQAYADGIVGSAFSCEEPKA
jgi:hypothetical protein